MAPGQPKARGLEEGKLDISGEDAGKVLSHMRFFLKEPS